MLLHCPVGILRVVERWKIMSYVSILDTCCKVATRSVRLHGKNNKDLSCPTIVPAISKVDLSWFVGVSIVSSDRLSILA